MSIKQQHLKSTPLELREHHTGIASSNYIESAQKNRKELSREQKTVINEVARLAAARLLPDALATIAIIPMSIEKPQIFQTLCKNIESNNYKNLTDLAKAGFILSNGSLFQLNDDKILIEFNNKFKTGEFNSNTAKKMNTFVQAAIDRKEEQKKKGSKA